MRFCSGTPGKFHRQVCIPIDDECPTCEEKVLLDAALEELREAKVIVKELQSFLEKEKPCYAS
jgi:hypothetical protein